MFWLLFTGILFIDQLSKLLAVSLSVGSVQYNAGVAFSWLDQLSPVVMFVILLVMGGVVFLVFRQDWQEHLVISGLFWGATASNLIDRVMFGAVMDWIVWPVGGITNNIADMALSIALVLLLFSGMRQDDIA